MSRKETYNRLLDAVIYHVKEGDEGTFKEAYEDIMEALWEGESDDSDNDYDECIRRQKAALADILEGVKALRR